MRFKARYLLEQGEMQQSKGLYIYNDNNDEFAINMTKERNCLEYTNKNLKELAVYCNISANLTMYVARHSWASIAHNVLNVPISVISKGMGYSNEKVTQVYLASFGNKDIDKANESMIGCII